MACSDTDTALGSDEVNQDIRLYAPTKYIAH